MTQTQKKAYLVELTYPNGEVCSFNSLTQTKPATIILTCDEVVALSSFMDEASRRVVDLGAGPVVVCTSCSARIRPSEVLLQHEDECPVKIMREAASRARAWKAMHKAFPEEETE